MKGVIDVSDRLNAHRDGSIIYDIVIENSYDRLGEELKKLNAKGRRLCVVTDSHVAPLYFKTVEAQLSACCGQVDLFVFPAGEENKNLDTVKELYEFLILKRYDRGDMLAALGGGVVGDLCGFAAATYLRGIRFIQLPTTLLSQVDSSVGGKTGVDFKSWKNMVGAFHMPALVYTGVSSLLSLTEEQFACGMGEIIKHGLIKNREYYEWLLDNAGGILARDPGLCEQMILVSNRIKRDVVEHDPTEKGERALLNFGHTLGHAIETLMNFKLLHGQCVALGSVAAAYLSFLRGNLSMGEVLGIRDSFERFGLPVSTGGLGLRADEVVAATKNDKKMESGQIKFILLHGIGEAYIDRTVTDDELKETLRWLEGGRDER